MINLTLYRDEKSQTKVDLTEKGGHITAVSEKIKLIYITKARKPFYTHKTAGSWNRVLKRCHIETMGSEGQIMIFPFTKGFLFKAV